MRYGVTKGIRGRGALENLPNRFEEIEFKYEPDEWDEDAPPPSTRYYKDVTQAILSKNDSPDIGFTYSINPYRGCEHGCIYCYARPTHEYLGMSLGLDFETKIMVKTNAAELLRKELKSKRWDPQVIAFSGVTDCYQPVERKLKITRSCMEVLADFRNPAGIVTKNHLVTRDIDLFSRMAEFNGICVFISITTLRNELVQVMEPRTSRPESRLKAIRELSQAGIPVGVNVAPIIPGLNDYEIPEIVAAAVDAGAKYAGHIIVRLPYGLKDLFDQWLLEHFPTQHKKIINRIKSVREGKLNETEFGSRMRGEGIFADQIHQLFEKACRDAGIAQNRLKLAHEHFRIPDKYQLHLWD